jgi:hypothetical protein
MGANTGGGGEVSWEASDVQAFIGGKETTEEENNRYT